MRDQVRWLLPIVHLPCLLGSKSTQLCSNLISSDTIANAVSQLRMQLTTRKLDMSLALQINAKASVRRMRRSGPMQLQTAGLASGSTAQLPVLHVSPARPERRAKGLR